MAWPEEEQVFGALRNMDFVRQRHLCPFWSLCFSSSTAFFVRLGNAGLWYLVHIIRTLFACPIKEILNQGPNFYETWYEHHTTGDYSSFVRLNFLPVIILTWRSYELPR
jgi:hypothetical protein